MYVVTTSSSAHEKNAQLIFIDDSSIFFPYYTNHAQLLVLSD